jgi:hypothetical protein
MSLRGIDRGELGFVFDPKPCTLHPKPFPFPNKLHKKGWLNHPFTVILALPLTLRHRKRHNKQANHKHQSQTA